MAKTRRRTGRRRLADDAASAYLHLRVTPGQQLDIRRVAQENGTNVSGVLREAVNEYVSDFREARAFRITKD